VCRRAGLFFIFILRACLEQEQCDSLYANPHPTGPVAPRATPEKCSTVAAEPNAIRAGPVGVTTCKLETKNMVRPDSVGHRLHSYT
jgi:hypothetical protein